MDNNKEIIKLLAEKICEVYESLDRSDDAWGSQRFRREFTEELDKLLKNKNVNVDSFKFNKKIERAIAKCKTIKEVNVILKKYATKMPIGSLGSLALEDHARNKIIELGVK